MLLGAARHRVVKKATSIAPAIRLLWGGVLDRYRQAQANPLASQLSHDLGSRVPFRPGLPGGAGAARGSNASPVRGAQRLVQGWESVAVRAG